MNQRKQYKKATTLLAALTIALTIVGCGGGSSTTTSNESTNLPQTKIDTNNQKQVLATLFDSIDNVTPQLPSSASTSSDDSIQLANTALAKILPNYKSLSATSEPYTCSEGGSISASADGSDSIINYGMTPIT